MENSQNMPEEINITIINGNWGIISYAAGKSSWINKKTIITIEQSYIYLKTKVSCNITKSQYVPYCSLKRWGLHKLHFNILYI